MDASLGELELGAKLTSSLLQKVVKYFPEWKLTENVQERLASLFAIKEKWTMEEIAPFVEKLTAPKLNVNALLTKYSRVSMINGVKHFSSKHGK